MKFLPCLANGKWSHKYFCRPWPPPQVQKYHPLTHTQITQKPVLCSCSQVCSLPPHSLPCTHLRLAKLPSLRSSLVCNRPGYPGRKSTQGVHNQLLTRPTTYQSSKPSLRKIPSPMSQLTLRSCVQTLTPTHLLSPELLCPAPPDPLCGGPPHSHKQAGFGEKAITGHKGHTGGDLMAQVNKPVLNL